MNKRKLLFLRNRGANFMLDRNLAQSDLGTRPHPFSSTLHKQIQLMDVLEELRDLLEEYAPTWYTEEQREKVLSVLQSRKRT